MIQNDGVKEVRELRSLGLEVGALWSQCPSARKLRDNSLKGQDQAEQTSCLIRAHLPLHRYIVSPLWVLTQWREQTGSHFLHVYVMRVCVGGVTLKLRVIYFIICA